MFEGLTPDQLLAGARPEVRKCALRVLGDPTYIEFQRQMCLSYEQRKWLADYMTDMDLRRVGRIRGMNGAKMQTSIAQQMAMRDSVSILKAEYVREYLLSVLEFCPTDYFIPAEEGGWTITLDGFKALPTYVKRLIEDIEYRVIRGQMFLAVRFVSKSQALSLAARYTLPSKVILSTDTAPVATINWDDVVRPAVIDPIEDRIRALEGVGK